MAINIMKELQDRMKKIEYVTMDSIEMIKLFNNGETNKYDSERIDKIAEDVENILKKINTEIDTKRRTGEAVGNEELLYAVADIYGLVYEMQESMITSTGKQSKSQSSKTLTAIIDSIENILDNKGIKINSTDNGEESSYNGISYKGKTVRYERTNM